MEDGERESGEWRGGKERVRARANGRQAGYYRGERVCLFFYITRASLCASVRRLW